MLNIEFDKTAFEWSYYGTLQHKFKLNLRHLFYSLDFAGMVEDAPLLEAVTFLQALLRQGKSPRQVKPVNFQTAVMAKGMQRYMYTKAGKRRDKQLDVDRYEFLVYRLLRNAMEAGNVYVKDSNDFRSFEDDLINAERWKDKDAVLREIGAPLLLTPIEATLTAFREELDAKFKRVNERIENGDNKHIKLTGSGDERRWSLVYPSEEEPINTVLRPGSGYRHCRFTVVRRGKDGLPKRLQPCSGTLRQTRGRFSPHPRVHCRHGHQYGFVEDGRGVRSQLLVAPDDSA